jgi:hypothetical protein
VTFTSLGLPFGDPEERVPLADILTALVFDVGTWIISNGASYVDEFTLNVKIK